MAARRPPAVPPTILDRLVPLGGSARRFLDPKTQQTYSRRAVQTARAGYVTPEARALVRKVLGKDAPNPTARQRALAEAEGLRDAFIRRLQDTGVLAPDERPPTLRELFVAPRTPSRRKRAQLAAGFREALAELAKPGRAMGTSTTQVTYPDGRVATFTTQLYGARSRKAKALVRLGLRPPNASWRVGETDQAKATGAWDATWARVRARQAVEGSRPSTAKAPTGRTAATSTPTSPAPASRAPRARSTGRASGDKRGKSR